VRSGPSARIALQPRARERILWGSPLKEEIFELVD